jgi:hypothetical protein
MSILLQADAAEATLTGDVIATMAGPTNVDKVPTSSIEQHPQDVNTRTVP